jgi:hypothetical protein
VDAFIERLEQTGRFSELLSRDEAPEEETGLVRVMVTGRYDAAAGAASPAAESRAAAPLAEARR